ncbi:MAG TPA: TerC family protein [Pirellulales bacterium]|nr:TerC family protein [Pirellulales bacterium]
MIQFTLWHWLGFGGLVIFLLAADLGLFHRHSRDTSIREAAISTVIWCCLALAFNGYILAVAGKAKAIEFLTGYLVEWSLSMDNVFVFAVIFAYFRVPMKYQYRVLFWGIIGAVVLRLAFILVGTALLSKFGWIIYVLGLFLIYTGIKLVAHDDEFDPEKSLVIRVSRKLFRVCQGSHGDRFFVRESGLLCITPLFLVLLVIDFVDVAFALDSVPAILGITNDTFIVFTSNIFAILGLRALYFLLAGAMDLFRYLRYGLAAILVFVGLKMLLADLIKDKFLGGEEIPHWVSLAVVVTFLAIAILASVIAAKRDERKGQRVEEGRDETASGGDSEEAAGPAGNGPIGVTSQAATHGPADNE